MTSDVLGKLIRALNEAGVEFVAEDLVDALWLAPQLEPRPDAERMIHEALHLAPDAESESPADPAQLASTGAPSETVARPQTTAQRDTIGAYLPPKGTGFSEGISGVAVRLPEAAALPHARSIARALKPLRRRQETTRILLMNETRTADQLAVSDIWFPIFFSGKERWLSATIVIDIGASMAIWRNVIRELRRVLASLGAFRKLEHWWLDTEDPAWTQQSDGPIPLFGSERSRIYHRPLDIVHPSGRQLIFVVSDCVGDAWWDGRAARLLGLWGKTSHVVVLQVLPQSMWERTALSEDQKVVLRSSRAACPNSDLKALVKSRFGGPVSVQDATLPAPVLELETDAIGEWSKWVAQDAGGILPGRALTYDRPTEQVGAVENSSNWSQAPGQPFLTVASRTARKLANIMAVAPPFNLPLLRVIRESMLGGEATQVHEAEFLLGGLVKVVAERDHRFDRPDDVLYDFQTDELRKLFRAAVRVPDALDLLRIEKVSQYLASKLGQQSSFRAYLASPASHEGAINMSVPADRGPIARFTKDVLQWLGPPYDRLIGRDEIIPDEQAEQVQSAKWILVAGTGLDDLPEPVVGAAEQVGRWLGLNGYGLITGGWKGVDYIVASVFARTLRDAGLPIENYLKHVVLEGRIPKFRGGQRISADVGLPTYEQTVALADGVVLIGGRGLTRATGQHSLDVHKPLYPLASTGGAAQNMHAEMVANWDSLSWHPMSREEFLTLSEQTLNAIKDSLNRFGNKGSPLQGSLQSESRPPAAAAADVSAVSGTELDDIQRDPAVAAVAPVIPLRSIAPPPSSVSEPSAKLEAGPALGWTWGIEAVGAHQSPFSGSGVTVAILCEGIDADHHAFRGVSVELNDLIGQDESDSNASHGTHVAATILGRDIGGMRIGIARGVSRLLVARVMDRNSGSSETLIEGLQWASQRGANIIALFQAFDYPGMVATLVGQGYPVAVATSRALTSYTENLSLFQKLITALQVTKPSGNPLIIVPAGNDSSRRQDGAMVIDKSFPGNLEGVVSVGAIRESAERRSRYGVADFSNGRPSLAAPGVDIISARPGGGLIKMSGTSMAAAHAVGVAALWAEKLMRDSGRVDGDNLSARLMATARPLDLSPTDVGDGLIVSPPS
ncbi:SAV_2336 N-terminal domain-related protein [Bradyrhizobium barranii]|uniref:SAV_2336 N-terminal domain-related protein n=1 Tax=Bradyrhizobium barranii TaxID=2992140 RepID=UPI0024AF9F7E|nr:SAV_2336 N-terminal domain-related protein [Bradyrhizobium barranii]WFT94418.1 SAV_2336 N-terminal domain-related protein [Bradyrhizobium barranii]